jgi:hypothetical protein
MPIPLFPAAARVSFGAADAAAIRGSIDALAAAISAIWLDLSPEAQARALALESKLASVRRLVS